MRRRLVILLLLALLFSCGNLAAQDTLNTTTPKKPAGFDAGRLIGAGRSRPANISTFVNSKFSDNLSLALLAQTRAPYTEDYGFAYSAVLGINKWFTPSVGLRMEMLGGYVPSNRTGIMTPELSFSTSVLFNLSSYIGGYNLGRFCEVSALVGAGYSCILETVPAHYVTAKFGADVRMKMSDRVSLNVVPYIPMHVNKMGFRYGFGTSIGLLYDFSSNVQTPGSAGRYFITLSGGLQLQNSAQVRDARARDFIGVRYDLGFGRRFTDCFDLRAVASYSTHTWMEYSDGTRMPSDYYAIRMEGVLDLVRLLMHRSTVLGAGLVAGPEAGIMIKKDLDYTLREIYVGLSCGLHADCRLGKNVSFFIEPRFNIVPYTAPNDGTVLFNVNRNYYDALFNLMAGLEISIGK
jgi:hypothetical protein